MLIALTIVLAQEVAEESNEENNKTNLESLTYIIANEWA